MDHKGAVKFMRVYAKAKDAGAKRITEFNQSMGDVLGLLVHEGVANYMSAEQIAKECGVTAKRVRLVMKSSGLSPALGKRTLADYASKALITNAELMGIKPWQMDLTSPLAYLPMGEKMKKEIAEARNARVTEEPEEYGDREQLAQKLTDAGLSIEDAREWINEVIQADRVSGNEGDL